MESVFGWALLFTIHYSPFTINYLLFTIDTGALQAINHH